MLQKKILTCLTAVLLALGLPATGYAQESNHQDEKSEQHEPAGADEHAGEEAQDKRRIHLTSEQAALLDIETMPAPSGRAESLVSAPVEVQFVPSQVATVGPLLESKVAELKVDLGDKVRSGDVLAILSSVELADIRSRLKSLEARKVTAEAEFKREKELEERGISSEEDYLSARASYLTTVAELEATREKLKVFGDSAAGNGGLAGYTLRSPISGVVEKLDVSIGQTLTPTDTPFMVVNTSSVWAMIKVSETDIGQVSPGDEVRVTIRGRSESHHPGKVTWISSVLDRESRTIAVRAEIKTPDSRLRPYSFATAEIMTQPESTVPLVPRDAVQTIDQQDVVFVPGKERGEYEAVPVTLGDEANGWIEIRSGIEPETPVVSSGAFDLMSAITSSGRSASHGH